MPRQISSDRSLPRSPSNPASRKSSPFQWMNGIGGTTQGHRTDYLVVVRMQVDTALRVPGDVRSEPHHGVCADATLAVIQH
jgi:hypothetical protein